MFTLTFDQLQNLATFHIAEVQVNCKISRSEMFTLTFDLNTALVDALGLDEKPDDTIELRVRILQ